MKRVVLDPGVLVSALITPTGAPAALLLEVRGGGLELIVSPLLIEELEGVLKREKFRSYVDLDPEGQPPLISEDPDDDYLIALAHSQSAVLVSGDKHLLNLGRGAPILSPADLLETLQPASASS